MLMLKPSPACSFSDLIVLSVLAAREEGSVVLSVQGHGNPRAQLGDGDEGLDLPLPPAPCASTSPRHRTRSGILMTYI